MHFQADPVSKRVPELLRQTDLLQVIPGDRVCLTAAHPSPDLETCLLLRHPDRVVHNPLFAARTSNDNGSGDVGTIALVLSAEIEEEEIAALDHAR